MLFSSNRSGRWTINAATPDGSGVPEPLPLPADYYAAGSAPSESGRGAAIVLAAYADEGLGLISLPTGASSAIRLSAPRAVEMSPRMSPDGRWLAYIARDTGGLQLYVRDFPEQENKLRISTEGAVRAAWAADGRKLYFQNGDRIMEVAIQTQPALAASRPQAVVEVPGLVDFDVTQDGRFLTVRMISPPPIPQLIVIPDWYALLPDSERIPRR